MVSFSPLWRQRAQISELPATSATARRRTIQASRRAIRLALLGVASIFAGCTRAPDAEFVTSVPWGLLGPTVILDSHTHTTFSDGALTPQALVSIAVENGCTAFAITDHGDLSTKAATPEYFAQIDAARAQFPDLILFAGMEWNIPPYLGREHVNILLDPALERTVLPEFKARFEADNAIAANGLRWLAQQVPDRDRVILVYNHPSRLDTDPQENDRDYITWNEDGGLFVGFEGGPGHQKAPSPGDYRGKFRTEARWDPVAAQVDGTWDRLLDAGYNVWGALAVSDYHNADLDYAPCAFARTHVRVPQRDHRSVLTALRAGSFWADQGGILNDFAFVLVHRDLLVPATAGEVIRATPSAKPTLRVKIRRGPAAQGLPVTIELIGNGGGGKPERVASRELSPTEDTFDWQPTTLVAGKDQKSAYFRARAIVRKSPDDLLMAYSNPIRILLRN